MGEFGINFDKFLVEKWLPEGMGDSGDADEKCEIAYRECYRKIKNEKVISRSILRKWFGIGGKSCPKREQIIKLAFAAHFTTETLQEYLEEGLFEQGLQLNDYREMIFLYGLEHGCSYQECLDMITVFERHVNQGTVIMQKTHTEQLRGFYNTNRTAEREEFLLWMCGHAEYFKGYSRVALKHFSELKNEIIEYIIEAANEELKKQLKELGYYEWAHINNLKEDDKVNIQRYVRNISKRKGSYISEVKKKEISNLIRVAYMDRQTNRYFLRDIYQTSAKNISLFEMNDKMLSQLLHISDHKEREIRLTWACSCLNGIEDKNAACPQWIRTMMEEFGFPAMHMVGEAEAELNKRLKNQRQCCHLIRRKDLLLMLHYAAYMRYEMEVKRGQYKYNQQNAKDEFIKYANDILSDCQMAKINERYQMDRLLLSAYKETDMNTFADLVEELEVD